MLELLTGRWWWLLVRGIVAILFGLAAFFLPGVTLLGLIYLFGVFAIVDGVTLIVFGRRAGMKWYWSALAGLVSIAAGVVAFAWPGLSAVALLWVIAFWAILNGIFQILTAIEIRKEVEGEWVLFLAGALAVAFGVILLFRPGAGVFAVLWLIGTFAILLGILMIILSFKLKGLQGRVKDAREAIQDARGGA
jgi:uncharacterized membrane protein HdeD (DUF308 family)